MQALSLVRLTMRSGSLKADFVRKTGVLCKWRAAPVCLTQPAEQIKKFHTTPSTLVTFVPEDDRGIFARVWEKIKYHIHRKPMLQRYGWLIYRDSIDRIEYLGFFKEFGMPDTYFSWFLITELHVWMLMVRLMAEEVGGQEAKYLICQAMWADATARKSQLGYIKEGIVREHMALMGDQFKAAILGYDEGLLSNDKVLANAVWKRFFISNCDDPELVERMVIYIRKTMIMLDNISFEDIVDTREIPWLDYKKCRP